MTSVFTDTEVERIARAFLARTLPKPEWTHAAHFAAVLWVLRHRPDLGVPDRFGALVFAYNEASGTANTDTGGYHATITSASMRAAAAWLHLYPSDASLGLVLGDLMATELGRSDWLLRYWSRERLFSVAARRAWMQPDIAPLPTTLALD